jgi:uncharacterized protein YjbI with pentapeptide repeats
MPEQHRFENQQMSESVFRDCALARTRFDDVNLSESVFADVNLQRARFANVNLTDASIDDAKIDGLTILGYDISALIQAEVARRQRG